MNYEQKYKEALERASRKYKIMIEQNSTLAAGMLEELFPELAESEDERIRKALIEVFKKKLERGFEWVEYGIPNRSVLAWLEKQKENPKSADSIPSDCVSYAKCEDRDSHYGVFPEDVVVVARACEKLETHGYPELAYALKNVNLYTKEQKTKHFELKAGKWYICHRAFCCRADHLTVKEGERFQCEKDGIVKGFVIKEPEKYFKECSAPAPMEDEQKEQKPSEDELAKRHLEGYIMGREDTMRKMKDFIESHFNCENAKKGTPIVYNTQSGTSTLKAER